jgi:myo-inositol-1(or 4)-monophosphatase
VRVQDALPRVADRARELGRGEGGDMTLAVDRAAEDEILAELGAGGRALTVVSEECGEVELNGGGPPFAVVDPIDGSLNAKRGLPFHAVSIAIAAGRALSEVEFGYVLDLASGAEWHAGRGHGAHRDGERLPPLEPGPLEVLGLETARPKLVAEAAGRVAGLEARRLRVFGSVALSLCLVADGRIDAMLSLREVRSVDAAAGALIVSEAGGVVSYADARAEPGIGLDFRSRVFAARDPALLERLAAAF